MDIIPPQGSGAWQTVPPASTGAPGTIPFPIGFHIEGAKQQLIGAIRARNVTDRRLSIAWYLVPILTYIIGAGVVFAIAMIEAMNVAWIITPPTSPLDIFSAFAMTILAGTIYTILVYVLFAVLAYKLVERQNEHYEREAHLRMGVMSLLRAAAGSPEKEAIISAELATMNMIHSEASTDETKHSPIAWALVVGLTSILSIITLILSLYMFYFLMKTIYNHDRRWHDFMAQTYSALGKLGYQYTPIYGVHRLENKSFALYLVLSIVTLGFFGLYWWYVLVDDPNNHFRYQWYVEDNLANMIGQK